MDFEGFYGEYEYELRSGDRRCTGSVMLEKDPNEQPVYYGEREGREIIIQCDWRGHVHIPVFTKGPTWPKSI